MKRFFVLGAVALMSIIAFSCTAEDYVNNDTKADVKKEIISTAPTVTTYANDGPGDAPIPVPEPK